MNANNKVGIVKSVGKLIFQVPDKVDKIERQLEKVRTCAMCNELRAVCNSKLDAVIKLLEDRGGG